MASIVDFSKHISQLKQDKKYDEALLFFKENKGDFTKERISDNECLISCILTCLKKTNHFDAGFKFLSIYNIVINKDTKKIILNPYGWLLWAKYKSENSNTNDIEDDSDYFDEDDEVAEDTNFHYDKDELIHRIEVLISILLKIDNDYSKTLISNLFSIVPKCEKKKPTPNWRMINDFCNNFKPEDLSKDCSTIQVEKKGQLKDMELASDMENWFAYKTKALFKLGKWQECCDTSKQALESIDNFHYLNDVWVARRIALAKKNLGNTEEAIKELRTILIKKKDWFIQKELAELCFEGERLKEAFKYVKQAITNFGPLEFKVNLLLLFGRILNKKNEKDLAFKHFTLSKLIRQSKGWKIPKKLLDELQNFENAEISINDIGKLKSELKKYWNGFLPEKKEPFPKPKETQKGEIVKIMNDNEKGKDGFLKSNNMDFYFSLPLKFHLTPKVEIGTKVEFNLTSKGGKERAMITNIIE